MKKLIILFITLIGLISCNPMMKQPEIAEYPILNISYSTQHVDGFLTIAKEIHWITISIQIGDDTRIMNGKSHELRFRVGESNKLITNGLALGHCGQRLIPFNSIIQLTENEYNKLNLN